VNGSLWCLGKGRRDWLDAPDRAPFVELTFFLGEGWSLAAKDPDVDVGELLAEDGGEDAGNSAKLDFNAVVGCFVADATDRDRVFALRCNDDMDQARFRGGHDEGYTGWRSSGIEVQ
jgi:hypothetical protein